MTLDQLLRTLLARYPWLFRTLNRYLPGRCLNWLRTLAEKLKYRGVSEVHELPEVFHYWSNRHLRPLLREAGFETSDDFIYQHVASFRDHPIVRVASLGCGNGEPDLRLVRRLLDAGMDNLQYECVEFNGAMLERAREEAKRLGLQEVMRFTQVNLAQWRPTTALEVVIAVQVLHHVEPLEALFDRIQAALTSDGLFLADDMIGRNGHMRWPEALSLVNELWSELDDRYKFHHFHRKTNREFVNWDCSITGFEGIRAQDILPLLLERFEFRTFLAFGNLIDVFIERPYGPNFDMENPRDRAFIDRVHALDQRSIEAGVIKPTHMLAALCRSPVDRSVVIRGLTPDFCLRRPDAA